MYEDDTKPTIQDETAKQVSPEIALNLDTTPECSDTIDCIEDIPDETPLEGRKFSVAPSSFRADYGDSIVEDVGDSSPNTFPPSKLPDASDYCKDGNTNDIKRGATSRVSKNEEMPITKRYS